MKSYLRIIIAFICSTCFTQVRPYEMTFIARVNDKSVVISSFDYRNNKTFFSLVIAPELPSYMPLEEQSLMIQQTTPSGMHYWTLANNPSHTVDGLEACVHSMLNPEDFSQNSTLQQPSYLLARRTIMGSTPLSITTQQCASLIKNKRVLFYTGAGISAGTVPTMNQLLAGLDCETKERKVHIHKAITCPNEYITRMDHFYTAMIHGTPTAAHWSLASMVQAFSWPLFTENIDPLHQKTGIDVIARGDTGTWYHEFLTDPTTKIVRQFDYIVVIGLGSDESGLLNWYKAQYPSVCIIAINLEQPPYLDNNDLFIEGDAQVIIPQIKKLLLSEKL